MSKKSHNTRPKKRPIGKQAPLAIDVFAERAKQKAQEVAATSQSRQDRIEKLKAEIIAEKDRSNRNHFAFAAGIIGGGGVANFLSFQIESLATLPAKALTTAVVGGLILNLNRDFFFINSVYKEMLRTTNALLEKSEEEQDIQIPKFKKLFDESRENREKGIIYKDNFRSNTAKNSANAAVILITSIALANIGVAIYTDISSDVTAESNPKEETKIKESLENNLEQPSPKPPQP